MKTHRRWIVLFCFGTLLSTLIVPTQLRAQGTPQTTQVTQSLLTSDEVSTNLVPTASTAVNNWESVLLPSNITAATISDLAVDPNNAAKIFLATRSGLYQSSDAGSTWTRVEAAQFTTIGEVLIAASDGQRLYVRTPDLFRSVDGGATWAKIASPPAVCGLAIAPSDANRLYARSCSDSGQPSVFRSDNGGESWQTALTTFTQTFDHLAVVPDQPDLLIAANFNHIYRSADGGVTWTELLQNKFYKARPVFDNKRPSTLYMGHWRGLLRSSDGGVTWEESGFEQELSTLMIAPDDQGIVGGYYTSTWQLTTDGKTWNATPGNLPQPLQGLWRSRLDATRSYALNPAGLWRLQSQPQPQPQPIIPIENPTTFVYLPLLERTTGTPRVAASAVNTLALERINYFRNLAGVTPLRLHPALIASAENHVAYYLANRSDPSAWIYGGHGQVAGKPHYMGQMTRDRVKIAGFPGSGGSEVLHYIGDPVNSVNDWMSTIFHRVVMLDPMARYTGYGNGKANGYAIDVMDFGSAPIETGVWTPALPYPLAYPANGQTGVPTSWTGNETPDPLPPGVTKPLGYPFTLQGVRGKLVIDSVSLHNAAGDLIDIHPNAVACENFNCYTVLAKAPLQPNTEYVVNAAGNVGGQPFQQQWRFTTGSESIAAAATTEAPLVELQ